MLRYLIIVIIYFSSVYSSCRKGIGCKEIIYSFSTNIRAYPDNDSINVNDTIWIEFSSPSQLNDINSGASINFSGAANLGTSIDFLKFTGGSISNPGVIPAANDFNYNLVTGIFISDPFQPEKNRDYKFIQLGDEYKFKLGIIPKQIGVFAIGVSDAPGIYRINDNCTKAGFQITFSNTNQHLYFYEQNRFGYTPSVYEQTHMYCFKVK
jgi:hypothetical protein